jgi:hypothetical protein
MVSTLSKNDVDLIASNAFVPVGRAGLANGLEAGGFFANGFFAGSKNQLHSCITESKTKSEEESDREEGRGHTLERRFNLSNRFKLLLIPLPFPLRRTHH